jgi:hypothetical protein
VSSDEPREPATVDPYDDLLGELVVAYAERLAMQGRFSALSAELDRIHRELSIINSELGAAGRRTAPLLAGKEQLLELISVSEASSAETTVYLTKMLPHLHTLLDRVYRRSQS